MHLPKCGSAARSKGLGRSVLRSRARGTRNAVPQPEATVVQPSLNLPARSWIQWGTAGGGRFLRHGHHGGGASHRAGRHAARDPISGDAAQQRGQPVGAAGAGRRAVPIQRADRGLSHKLVTYLSVSIPSCAGRSGARSVGKGTASVSVVRGCPIGLWSARLLPIYRYLRRPLPRFTAVYVHLFYTKSLY